jgi:hypothetical protein
MRPKAVNLCEVYKHSSRRYGCFLTQVVALRMGMIVSSYIGISMAFDSTLRAFVREQLWCSHCFGGVSSVYKGLKIESRSRTTYTFPL